MRNHQIPTLLLGAALVVAPAIQTQAAEVNLEWQNPDKYRDIEANYLESQVVFQQRVIDELGHVIREAADEHLADRQRLNMTVTDIDLAGDVDYFFTRFNQGVRVVTDLYFPSIEFSYELQDAQGNVIMSGEENVKDMGFQFSGSRYVSDAPFGYEERLIEDWFQETFGDVS